MVITSARRCRMSRTVVHRSSGWLLSVLVTMHGSEHLAHSSVSGAVRALILVDTSSTLFSPRPTPPPGESIISLVCYNRWVGEPCALQRLVRCPGLEPGRHIVASNFQSSSQSIARWVGAPFEHSSVLCAVRALSLVDKSKRLYS